MTNLTWAHRFLFHILFLTLIAIVPSLALAAKVPSTKELLAKVQNYENSIENLHSEAKWEKFKQGRLLHEDVVTHYKDELGRKRVIVEHIAILDSSDKRVVPELKSNEILFDGEKTVSQEYYPNRVTATGFQSEVELPANQLGYRTAQIFDGMWPPKVGPRVIRDVLFYSSDFCSALLETVEAGKAKGKVISLDENGKLFEFVCVQPGSVKTLRYQVQIDASRGWIVTRIQAFNQADNLLTYNQETEYTEIKEGLWAALKGVEQRWAKGEEEQPTIETRFSTQKVALNEEHFDESVFDIILLPDTVVSDLRYDVVYRVGQEKVFDDSLAKLAEQAKLKDQKRVSNTPITKELEEIPQQEPRIFWLILINGLILILLFLYYLVRRAKQY